MQKRILSLLVDNTAGVLSRISGLFSRRGYNIDSLTVGVTADERYSRMTVVCSGDSMILEQITKQLAKLVDVRDIKVLEPDNSVSRELVLVKVAARPEQREGIISIANIFRANVIDVGKTSLVIEMTGSKSKLSALIDLLGEYEILELARTGITGLSRGVILKGDIPIGVNRYSCDVWMEPKYFNLNGQAGAPPDDFSVNGQNWGFPTYNWHEMLKDDCQWWVRRFQNMSKFFDAYRIDHVLGFFRIWEIPVDSVHGLLGQFAPALGMTSQEIQSYGLNFQEDRFTRPFITLTL
jgi:acetolactate synthase I/III small subunit